MGYMNISLGGYMLKSVYDPAASSQIDGDVIPLSVVAAGDTVLYSLDTERTGTDTEYQIVKSMTVFRAGTYRVKYEVKASGAGDAFAKVYKNGVSHGTFTLSAGIDTYVSDSEDLVFAKGDTCELWAKVVSGNYTVKDFRLCGSAIAVFIEAATVRDANGA